MSPLSPASPASVNLPRRAPLPGAGRVVAAAAGNPRPAAQAEPESESRRTPWYIHWATLLRRVHDVDALACPCGGRLFFEELVTDAKVARDTLGGEKPRVMTGTTPVRPAHAEPVELLADRAWIA
ncbi:MAG: hypothetical protein IT373_24685 [Polyangiaceae bacterium]|nr:hypothetical protein [Polyangiaceae bacterium]